MKFERVTVFTLNDEERVINVLGRVDFCPVCGQSIKPLVKEGIATIDPQGSAWRIYQCPDIGCESAFIGKFDHKAKEGLSYSMDDYFKLKKVFPLTPRPNKFPETISEISPAFVSIYNQADHAEKIGLMDVCGVGFRKSLEFLIKDFCIHEHVDKSDLIKNTDLSKCIKTYVHDTHIMKCAERATWLGNDETHYERRWAGKDLDDLKVLIQLTVNFIDSSLLAKKYVEEMPQGKSR